MHWHVSLPITITTTTATTTTTTIQESCSVCCSSQISELLAKHTRNGRYLKNPKIIDKCMAISPPKPYCHKIRDKCMTVKHGIHKVHTVSFQTSSLLESSLLSFYRVPTEHSSFPRRRTHPRWRPQTLNWPVSIETLHFYLHFSLPRRLL